MGGAAAVLGAARALAETRPPVEVHVVIAACENLISDTAMRPGDIVTASNGRTIEVANTDAGMYRLWEGGRGRPVRRGCGAVGACYGFWQGVIAAVVNPSCGGGRDGARHGHCRTRGLAAMPKTNPFLPRVCRHCCLSTDAEGRLTLADALTYAADLPGVDRIVELSTLTGAVIAALGKSVGALLTPDDALAESLQASATAAGEPLWRLPLYAPYGASLDSSLADMSNLGAKGGVGAGTITAGLFLGHFVRPGVAWAHIDIAGTAWDHGGDAGATGYGVATLVHWVHAHGATEDGGAARSG